MLNTIILLGRPTKDPEVKKVNENAIAKFDLAVSNPRKEKDGERGTSFFRITSFGSLAENVGKYVRKGFKVAVQGSIQQETYLNKDGNKVVTYNVYADNIEFIDKPEQVEEPSVEEVPVEAPVEQAPKFDPYTGKPLNPEETK